MTARCNQIYVMKIGDIISEDRYTELPDEDKFTEVQNYHYFHIVTSPIGRITVSVNPIGDVDFYNYPYSDGPMLSYTYSQVLSKIANDPKMLKWCAGYISRGDFEIDLMHQFGGTLPVPASTYGIYVRYMQKTIQEDPTNNEAIANIWASCCAEICGDTPVQ